ncbi:MAG: YkgJ family cysteine cluster protein, partial [Desulfobacterales bacterium]|nr:YkgJ family cysteine cluster protein [Desulfobacterales bacterium]
MRFLRPDDVSDLAGVRLLEQDPFSFHCHSGLGCFNACCRNLNLFLHPYDVVRLKNRLAITSDGFLDRYVDVVLRPASFFPDVLLRMAEDVHRSCPFVADNGCTVYADRPDTCRKFPMEQAISGVAASRRSQRIYLFRPPDFCQGPSGTQRWTPHTWNGDSEARTYDRMTVRWGELKALFQTDPWRGEGPEGSRGKMAFMAVYNVDRFREFVLRSSFLKRYRLKGGLQQAIAVDDQALLLLGLEWVKLFLWGTPSREIR